ncbi:MAG: hypothetical protein A4S16_07545 [Proteobacteria bacterium SG_bin6]|nr:MAG: hypothetical protein A4S16_07545 [Proteobacteria bacterium SG_bin6]
MLALELIDPDTAKSTRRVHLVALVEGQRADHIGLDMVQTGSLPDQIAAKAITASPLIRWSAWFFEKPCTLLIFSAREYFRLGQAELSERIGGEAKRCAREHP